MRSVGRKNYAIEIILKNMRMLIDDTDLTVQVTSLRVLDDNSGVHYVLIGLRDNSNQEVDNYNKDQELIGKPEQVNGVNGNIGGMCDTCIFV